MTTTTSVRSTPGTPGRAAPRVGTPGWAIMAFVHQLGQWRATFPATLAFLAGAVLVVISLEIFDLPGGVLPAIPVLTMPLVPHSVRLLIRRILVVCLTMLFSYLIMSIFQQEPWMLLMIAMLVVYFGLFLVARGLDMLSYLVAVAMPVLLAWNASNSADLQSGIWMDFQLLMIGLLITGILGILFLRPISERLLITRITTPLRTIAAVIRHELADEPDEQPKVNMAELSGLERLLTRLRQEHGHGRYSQRMHIVADTTRMMVTWNELRSMLHELDLSAAQYAFLHDAAMDYRVRIATQLEENATALEENRAARRVPGIDEAEARFQQRILKGIREHTVVTTGDEVSIFHAAAALYQMGVRLVNAMTNATGHHVRGDVQPIPYEANKHRRPWSVGRQLIDAAVGRDRWAMIFAVKGVVVGLIAFTLASVFNFWGGAIVLLLMSLLLTTQNMGAVNSGFVLRMVGLVSAIFVCLLGLLVVMPNINDPWAFGLLLAASLLPGAIATQSPATASLGLSYCMSVFFVYTAPDLPSIDLTPLQQRAVSVAGATPLAWLVFLVVRPVYARDRIDDEIGTATSAIARSVRLAATPRTQHITFEMERDSRWESFQALDAMSRMVTDTRSEFESYSNLYQDLQELMRHLERVYVLVRFELRLRTMYDDSPCTESIDDDVSKALMLFADAIEALGEQTDDPNLPETRIIATRDAIDRIRRSLERITPDTACHADHMAMSQVVGLRLLLRELLAIRSRLEHRAEINLRFRPIVVGES